MILLNAILFLDPWLVSILLLRLSSSNVSGSYIGENNAKRENEFGVLASYISRRLLVFTGSVDVDLN